MKTGTKVWCENMYKKLVVGHVLKNGDVFCIDIFTTNKEGNFETYLVGKNNLQIGWNIKR